MHFSDYQEAAVRTNQFRDKGQEELLAMLLGIAGETGGLLAAYKKRLRDGDAHQKIEEQVAEELGDILWYVASISKCFGLPLEEVASRNLRKTSERWERDAGDDPSLYDEGWATDEQLPRHFRFILAPAEAGEERKVEVRTEQGGIVGDRLTDNSFVEDGYRYHDVMHLAFAACLGWSPVMRKLLRKKRKGCARIDEVEDGGRAQVVEEAIAAMVYAYAEDHDFLKNVRALDWELLKTIKRMTCNLEVSTRTEAEWEHAILRGVSVWEKLKTADGGVVVGDLHRRSLTYAPLEPQSG